MNPHCLSRCFWIALLHGLKNDAMFFKGLNMMKPWLQLCKTPNSDNAIGETIQNLLEQLVLNKIGDGSVKEYIAIKVPNSISGFEP